MKNVGEGIFPIMAQDGVVGVSLSEGSDVVFPPSEDTAYYLVNTDAFHAIAPRGSVAEVFVGEDGLEPADIVLASGNNRLELLPYAKAKGLQVLGSVREVRSWPGRHVTLLD